MVSKVINISLPEALLCEIDEAAAAEHRSRSEFIRESARRAISDRRLRWIQAEFSARARELGLKNEEDLYEFLAAEEK